MTEIMVFWTLLVLKLVDFSEVVCLKFIYNISKCIFLFLTYHRVSDILQYWCLHDWHLLKHENSLFNFETHIRPK